MELGIVGLGRMGAGLADRLAAAGHRCVAWDPDPDALAAAGGTVEAAADLEGLVAALEAPRAVWVMVPSGVADGVVRDVADRLEAGDVVVDGGNGRWADSRARAADLARRGVGHLDVGTSGGVWGQERGYCLMVGGEPAAVARLAPAFDALAPGAAAAPRTPGRGGDPAPAERGWLHCGPAGAGHYVKMVHNGIEYGMMASLAEGLSLLRHAGDGRHDAVLDAETAPPPHPGDYGYDLDVAAVAELWRRGSVIGSWLLDLTAAALVADPALEGASTSVADSGEGRWTVQAAVDLGVPTPVINAALTSRFASRGRDDDANRVLSAMRAAFGGHPGGAP